MADDWTAPVQRNVNDVVTATNWNEQVPDNITALKSAVMGDAQATDEVIQQHKTGTLAARPTPGKAGRLYYATDLGLWLFDDGIEWAPYHHNSLKCAYFGSDFAESPPATGNYNIWNLEQAGSGTLAAPANDDTIWELRTGTTLNSWAAVQNKGSGAQQVLLPSRPFVAMVRLKHLDVAAGTQIMYAGLYADPVDAPTDAIYVRKSSANVFAIVRSASTDRDTQDLGVDASAFNTYIIEYDGTNVKFYLDTWNAAGLELTTNNNLPTARMHLGLRHSVTTAPPSSRDTQLDFGYIWIARN